MAIYTKKTLGTYRSQLTPAQQTTFDQVVVSWNDDSIVINDTAFAQLPAATQTALNNLIARLGYS